MNRRELLRAAAALSVYGLPTAAFLRLDDAAAASSGSFDYAALKGRARALAAQAYVEPRNELPESLDKISWDDYQKLSFIREKGLWYGENLPFRIEMFHPGLFFKHPVQIYEIADDQVRHIDYDPRQFQTRGLKLGRLPKDLGYAGFRIHHASDWTRDIAAFLGASYFRAVGASRQYGLSARGLAIDTGLPRPEEFPRFSVFWIERPRPDATELVVYALLDSPSITGAYRFGIRPGETLVMDVDAALYPRKPIERLGIAPLTSMYQTGENDRRYAYDFRPEIHDSDGLALWTGAGEWIWRPLVNPRDVRVNSFFDDNPRGFGLLQRDRNFDHYQDDGVWYDRRPSLWVEPRHGWGKGAVQLVEIPTVDETFDNIVAFWNPEHKTQPGEELLFAYRLHWGAQPPVHPPLATVRATGTGLGGVVGRKRTYFSWRFAVDFAGGMLDLYGPDARIEAVVSASRGRIELVSARPLTPIGGWRALFDIVPPDTSTEPIDLRLYLRSGAHALSETWIYQWQPPPQAERVIY
ncbi:glucans biosynthesis protein [Fontimonas thermophila]|uniref:Glucans biosynthesis protein n=1 Tax=Fontimonas thermophila TaxID=1076937 RepID=A0A1I2JLQ8_9GAMM|nr:glucan biosynthesis protein D [Fontimonas thermophila]SFF53601.1 glucans biosynthesis protein [Fontimonas thermophila]